MCLSLMILIGFPSPALDSSDCCSNAYAAHAEAIRSALNKVVISEKHSRPFAGLSTSSEDEADEGSKTSLWYAMFGHLRS